MKFGESLRGRRVKRMVVLRGVDAFIGQKKSLNNQNKEKRGNRRRF
jgi:hypothetical protein